ncbi:MAG: hypothetical protein J7L77_02130 [Clostridiales bacterium]|nr:hypothetical protein [Clostridiales bacterium]
MNNRENTLRAYTFNKPDRIPVRYAISRASWYSYETHDLENLIEKYKYLFPGFQKGSKDKKNLSFAPYQIKNIEYTDSWGCTWKTSYNGITGAVIKHSLEKWDDLDKLKIPDPGQCNGWMDINWENIEKGILNSKGNDALIWGELRHGYQFLTMGYMRGYENLMFDMYDRDPRLDRLIHILEKFNAWIVEKYMDLPVDIMCFPEDLGSQKSLMMSPEMFRKYIKPTYIRLMKPAKDKNRLVHMHSDGYIMDIIDDLIECGVDIINLQDLVNGIDDIRKSIKGRIAIDLDIDRQDVTVNGSAKDIDDLIREEVIKLGSSKGGLSLIYGLYPGTPLSNAEAVMNAMEKYSFYYS